MDTNWMAHGLCAHEDPAIFFPSDGVGVIKAQRICRQCPKQEHCLEYALTNKIDHGVWGGESERARRRMIRKRNAIAAKAASKAARKAGRTEVAVELSDQAGQADQGAESSSMVSAE